MTIISSKKGYLFEIKLLSSKWGSIVEIDAYDHTTGIRKPKIRKGLEKTKFLHNVDLKNIIQTYSKIKGIESESKYALKIGKISLLQKIS